MVSRRPRLSLARAFMALAAGEPAAARAAVAALGTDLDAAGDSFQPSAGPAASLITNVPAAAAIARGWLAYLCGDARQMTEFAAQASARLHDGEWLLGSICRLNLALADWVSGRLGNARQNLSAGVAGWRAAGQQAMAA